MGSVVLVNSTYKDIRGAFIIIKVLALGLIVGIGGLVMSASVGSRTEESAEPLRQTNSPTAGESLGTNTDERPEWADTADVRLP